MRMAKSSSDQCENGRPNSAGLVVASTTTLCRSSGGKSPRSTAAREVGQALEPSAGEAGTPPAPRARIGSEILRHLPGGWAGALARTPDDAAAKGLGLWGGM